VTSQFDEDLPCTSTYQSASRRELHNEERRDLYSSPSIIRIIKSRRMRWAGHVARRGRRGALLGYGGEARWEENTRKTKTEVGR
jgi:hypothetical protein